MNAQTKTLSKQVGTWLILGLITAFIFMVSLGAMGLHLGFLPLFGVIIGVRFAFLIITGGNE